jgi:hypothetical protein
MDWGSFGSWWRAHLCWRIFICYTAKTTLTSHNIALSESKPILESTMMEKNRKGCWDIEIAWIKDSRLSKKHSYPSRWPTIQCPSPGPKSAAGCLESGQVSVYHQDESDQIMMPQQPILLRDIVRQPIPCAHQPCTWANLLVTNVFQPCTHGSGAHIQRDSWARRSRAWCRRTVVIGGANTEPP